MQVVSCYNVIIEQTFLQLLYNASYCGKTSLCRQQYIISSFSLFVHTSMLPCIYRFSSWHLCHGKDWPPSPLLIKMCHYIDVDLLWKTQRNPNSEAPQQRVSTKCFNLSVRNMDVGVSKSHLYFLRITVTRPCIQWQLSSECPENFGQLKVLFELVNMTFFFVKTISGLALAVFVRFWPI